MFQFFSFPKVLIEASGHQIRSCKAPNRALGCRLDPWATYVKPPAREEDGYIYDHYFWNPPKEQVYKLVHPRPSRPSSLRVYECHVGIRYGSNYQIDLTPLPVLCDPSYTILSLQFARGQDQYLQGVRRRRLAAHPEGRLQRHSDHGRYGTRLLRQLRIPGRAVFPWNLRSKWNEINISYPCR